MCVCRPDTIGVMLLLHGNPTAACMCLLLQGLSLAPVLPTGFFLHALTHSSPSFSTHTSPQKYSYKVGRPTGTGLQREREQGAAPQHDREIGAPGATTKSKQANTNAPVKHEALHSQAASGNIRWA